MASISGYASPTKAVSRSKPGSIRCIRIEFKGNGFEVNVDRVPKPSKRGMYGYEPDKPSDSMVFTAPGECLSYIEKCIGAKEHAAHEAAEMKGM
jgi:hypothetical protein